MLSNLNGIENSVVKRPKLTGLANVAYFTEDLNNTRNFFTEFLGFSEQLIRSTDAKKPEFVVIKINDRQFVELHSEREPLTSRMKYFTLETDDIEQMRVYLSSKGVAVPDAVEIDDLGNQSFYIADPNGTRIKMVESHPNGALTKGFDDKPNKEIVSDSMSHIGFLVEDVDLALDFYINVLGLVEGWRGGKSPEKVNWVHLQVPGSKHTIELMLYEEKPDWEIMGESNHMCLEVSDVDDSKQQLSSRKLPKGCIVKPIKTGINKKRQLNLITVDGTRVELMDKETIDGKPAVSSTAPLMRYVP